MEDSWNQLAYPNHSPTVICNSQGQYYWEQNSYIEEQPIWPYQQFQQNESVETSLQSYLEEIFKPMADAVSSLQDIAVQATQLASTVHQIQKNRMSHDDVQPAALLEVRQCDTSLDETP
ncbi:hypothetical protein A2U01_0013613, partial [Trifolium medium]|nr:hypothetical protein [Trifolium medium]